MNRRASPHSARRMRQRSINAHQIEAAIDWGLELPQARGRTAYFLGWRQLRQARICGAAAEPMRGIAVVVAADGTVVTAIRTHSTRRLRRRAR